jgi:hypothetical protein
MTQPVLLGNWWVSWMCGLKLWLRLEWREAVHENCKVAMLDFLQGLSQGSLLLLDLGYFSGLFL